MNFISSKENATPHCPKCRMPLAEDEETCYGCSFAISRNNQIQHVQEDRNRNRGNSLFASTVSQSSTASQMRRKSNFDQHMNNNIHSSFDKILPRKLSQKQPASGNCNICLKKFHLTRGEKICYLCNHSVCRSCVAKKKIPDLGYIETEVDHCNNCVKSPPPFNPIYVYSNSNNGTKVAVKFQVQQSRKLQQQGRFEIVSYCTVDKSVEYSLSVCRTMSQFDWLYESYLRKQYTILPYYHVSKRDLKNNCMVDIMQMWTRFLNGLSMLPLIQHDDEVVLAFLTLDHHKMETYISDYNKFRVTSIFPEVWQQDLRNSSRWFQYKLEENELKKAYEGICDVFRNHGDRISAQRLRLSSIENRKQNQQSRLNLYEEMMAKIANRLALQQNRYEVEQNRLAEIDSTPRMLYFSSNDGLLWEKEKQELVVDTVTMGKCAAEREKELKQWNCDMMATSRQRAEWKESSIDVKTNSSGSRQDESVDEVSGRTLKNKILEEYSILSVCPQQEDILSLYDRIRGLKERGPALTKREKTDLDEEWSHLNLEQDRLDKESECLKKLQKLRKDEGSSLGDEGRVRSLRYQRRQQQENLISESISNVRTALEKRNQRFLLRQQARNMIDMEMDQYPRINQTEEIKERNDSLTSLQEHIDQLKNQQPDPEAQYVTQFKEDVFMTSLSLIERVEDSFASCCQPDCSYFISLVKEYEQCLSSYSDSISEEITQITTSSNIPTHEESAIYSNNNTSDDEFRLNVEVERKALSQELKEQKELLQQELSDINQKLVPKISAFYSYIENCDRENQVIQEQKNQFEHLSTELHCLIAKQRQQHQHNLNFWQQKQQQIASFVDEFMLRMAENEEKRKQRVQTGRELMQNHFHPIENRLHQVKREFQIMLLHQERRLEQQLYRISGLDRDNWPVFVDLYWFLISNDDDNTKEFDLLKSEKGVNEKHIQKIDRVEEMYDTKILWEAEQQLKEIEKDEVQYTNIVDQWKQLDLIYISNDDTICRHGEDLQLRQLIVRQLLLFARQLDIISCELRKQKENCQNEVLILNERKLPKWQSLKEEVRQFSLNCLSNQIEPNLVKEQKNLQEEKYKVEHQTENFFVELKKRQGFLQNLSESNQQVAAHLSAHDEVPYLREQAFKMIVAMFEKDQYNDKQACYYFEKHCVRLSYSSDEYLAAHLNKAVDLQKPQQTLNTLRDAVQWLISEIKIDIKYVEAAQQENVKMKKKLLNNQRLLKLEDKSISQMLPFSSTSNKMLKPKIENWFTGLCGNKQKIQEMCSKLIVESDSILQNVANFQSKSNSQVQAMYSQLEYLFGGLRRLDKQDKLI